MTVDEYAERLLFWIMPRSGHYLPGAKCPECGAEMAVNEHGGHPISLKQYHVLVKECLQRASTKDRC